MRRLLVMSCGKRKRSDTTPLPALERYDGPPFRVLRRYLATHPASPPDIYILSAKFGLIPADHPILYYDQRLTPQRAVELRPSVQMTLARILEQREYEQIYLAVGREYAQAMDGLPALMPPTTSVKVAHGSQGRRLAQLFDWLYGLAVPAAPRTPRGTTLRRTDQRQKNPQLKGVDIPFTRDQALARARQALATDSHGCDRFHSWYVLLDGEHIAPKWLVCRLTGLSADSFTTHEALRTLTRLGFAVYRSEVL